MLCQAAQKALGGRAVLTVDILWGFNTVDHMSLPVDNILLALDAFLTVVCVHLERR